MSLFEDYALGAFTDMQAARRGDDGDDGDPAVLAALAQAQALIAVGAAIMELAEKVSGLPGSVG